MSDKKRSWDRSGNGDKEHEKREENPPSLKSLQPGPALLRVMESVELKRGVESFLISIAGIKKDLDFNAERLGKLEKEIQQNPNYRISLDDSISQEEQIKKLRL